MRAEAVEPELPPITELEISNRPIDRRRFVRIAGIAVGALAIAPAGALAMLTARSHGVATHSLHMKAMALPVA